jgi:death-on-curing protein
VQEPVWIREDVLLAIHRRLIAEHGGLEGVRDTGSLSSALARPRDLFAHGNDETDLPALAVAYAAGIASDHPFLDGNERVALVTCRTFLRLNAHDLEASQEDKYRTFRALAAGELGEDALGAWIRSRCVGR